MAFTRAQSNPQFPGGLPNPNFQFQSMAPTLDSIFNAYMASKQQGNAEAVQDLAMRKEFGGTNPLLLPPEKRAEGLAGPATITRPGQGPVQPGEVPFGQSQQYSQDSDVSHLQIAMQRYRDSMALGSQKAQSEIALNNAHAQHYLGTAGSDSYTVDQAASLVTPNGEAPEATKQRLMTLYPGGRVPKDFAHVAATNNRMELTTGVRQDQFDQKQWEEINKRTNPNIATKGSLLGTAGTVNARADRALQTLNSKQVTNQMLAGVAADIAGILKGGTPDQQAEKEQGYGSLYGDIIKAESYLSGVPKDAVADPKLIEHLRDRVNELKKVDNKIIQDNLTSAENVFGPTINRSDKSRQQWDRHKQSILATTAGIQEQSGAPKVGEVRKGYRFKGGNPADRASWEQQ